MGMIKKSSLVLIVVVILVFTVFSLGGCSKKYLGWGVLLWTLDEPLIPSGTVLPIQLRSNIEQAWIAIIPDEYKIGDAQFAMVPLPHLEFFSSRRKAEKYAASFEEYAVTYAETIQDGLPIRDKPENSARRTYRLKEGEIIKILEKAEGVEAVGATGAPLEGSWFKVLTQSGSIGYCFSYRLRMFEHGSGPLGTAATQAEAGEDKDLDLILSRIWYPESYGIMINSGRLDLDALSKNYSFTTGIASRRARIHLEKGSVEFRYRKITKTGDRSWTFEDTPLSVALGPESKLEVRWEDENNRKQSEIFITLPVSVENIVNQEKERRQNRYQSIYNRGPRFTSSNFGSLIFNTNGSFNWEEFETLPEGMLPASVLGSGQVDLEYSLAGEMADRYTGAMALSFNAVSGSGTALIFAYTLDNQGLRMEHVPREYVPSRTVSRRAPSPFVVFFNADH